MLTAYQVHRQWSFDLKYHLRESRLAAFRTLHDYNLHIIGVNIKESIAQTTKAYQFQIHFYLFKARRKGSESIERSCDEEDVSSCKAKRRSPISRDIFMWASRLCNLSILLTSAMKKCSLVSSHWNDIPRTRTNYDKFWLRHFNVVDFGRTRKHTSYKLLLISWPSTFITNLWKKSQTEEVSTCFSIHCKRHGSDCK